VDGGRSDCAGREIWLGRRRGDDDDHGSKAGGRGKAGDEMRGKCIDALVLQPGQNESEGAVLKSLDCRDERQARRQRR